MLRIDVIADASDASKGLSTASGDLDDLGKAADRAGKKVHDAGGHADDLSERFGEANSKSSQLAGAFGDLGGALAQTGGPVGALGTGMELLGPSIMGLAGATDLLELATGTLSLTNLKAAASTAIETTATWAQAAAAKAAELATKGWELAQALLNAVMDANPIVLVALAVAALAAVFIVAWKKSETFRDIVKGVFDAVAAAAKWLWNTVLKPIWDLWKIQFELVGKGMSLVWTNVLRPLFTTIGGIAKTGFGAVKTAIGWISSAITTAWDTVRSIGGKIVGFFTGLPGKIAGIGTQIYNAGKAIIKAVFDGMKAALHAVGGFAADIAREIWNAIAGFINRYLIDPIKDFTIKISIGPYHHTFNPFGSLPEIPTLDTGGVVSSPTLALLSANSKREIVTPEALLRDIVAESSGPTYVLNVYGPVDKDAAARELEKLLDGRARRIGGVHRIGTPA